MNEQSDITPQDAEAALLESLGARVRSIRTQQGMSRRVLSEVSGISPRYLAQLESGEGNISIRLLRRVAQSLGLGLTELLAGPAAKEEERVLTLFRKADDISRADVIRRLQRAVPDHDRARRVCLIGLRGAGKSTLGKRLGQQMSVPFIELNNEIETHGQMPVSEIMALYGSDGYRRMEAEAVQRVADRHDKIILAVAGGIVSDPETYADVLARYHTIWVKAAPEDHMNRVRAQGDMRPMKGQPEAMNTLRSILAEREIDYSKAEAALDTTGKSVEVSLAELAHLIVARKFFG